MTSNKSQALARWMDRYYASDASVYPMRGHIALFFFFAHTLPLSVALLSAEVALFNKVHTHADADVSLARSLPRKLFIWTSAHSTLVPPFPRLLWLSKAASCPTWTSSTRSWQPVAQAGPFHGSSF